MFQPHTTKQLRDAVKNYYYHGDRRHGHIHTWDTSKITDMSELFVNMTYMFYGCASFNQPLSRWDISSVTTMVCMFYRCTSFVQPMGQWNVQHNSTVFTGCPDPEYCCTVFDDGYVVK